MPRPQVLVTRLLPPEVMDRLRSAFDVSCWPEATAMPRDVFLDSVAGKEAVITLLTDRVDAELLDAAGAQLRIVANYAVGFDNVDLAACTKRRVMVANTPDVLTESTADMAFALMMAAARRVVEGDRLLRSTTPWIWGPEMMLGRDVYGKTLGIIGMGRIGAAVASRAAAYSMRVVYHNPAHSSRPSAGLDVASGVLPRAGPEAVSLDHLLAISDFVSLHVQLSEETRHLIDAGAIARMKLTAVLVNTSRGPVVDEEALADALAERRLFAAGLDVFEREPLVSPRLLGLDSVVLSPHLGSATVDTRLAMGMLAVDNVVSAFSGQRPPTLLNAEVGELNAEEWEPSQPGALDGPIARETVSSRYLAVVSDYVIPEPEPKEIDERLAIELRHLAENAVLRGRPSGDERCESCRYYLEPSSDISYCWHSKLRILVGAQWWCQWWEADPGPTS